MIEQELLSNLRDVAATCAIKEMRDSETLHVFDSLRQVFVISEGGQWWWDNLSVESVSIDYGDTDGLSVISNLLENTESVVLVPTDDEAPPWPAFFGHTGQIMDLLKELRFFEYFLTDGSHTWVIFDTHHNSLVVAGVLVDKAKEVKASLAKENVEMADDLEKKHKHKHKDKETQSTQDHEIYSLIDRLKKEPCNYTNEYDLEIVNIKNKLKECKDELKTDNLIELDECVCKKLKKDRLQKNAGIV